MARGYHQFLEEHWDRLNGGDQEGAGNAHEIKPMWPVCLKEDADDETKQITEFVRNLEALEDEQEERAYNQLNNIRFYHAAQALEHGKNVRATDYDGVKLSKSSEFVINHARDFVRQSVSRLMRYSPNISVLPQNNEYTDRLGARYSKRVIDNIFYLNDIRATCERSLTEGKICGETFVFVEYDPYIGDKDPAVMDFKAQMEGQAAEETGSNQIQVRKNRHGKETFTDIEGEEVEIDLIKRIGEVAWPSELPWLVFHQPAWQWKDVKYIYLGRIRHIDDIKAENPDIDLSAVEVIAPTKNRSGSMGPAFRYGQWVVEYQFFHKRDRFLDNGYYCRFIKGQILERGDLPYSSGELPVVRWTDIDDPLNAHGLSFLEDLRPPLVLHNRLMNLMYRNIAVGATPKLLLPEGTCNPYSVSNGPFIIEYQYPMKPEIVTFNTVGAEVFGYSDNIMRQATQLSGTFGPSRGDTLPNARAASILNFYEEQESEKESSNIAKYSAYIEKLGRLSLGTAGDFYEASDGRTIRVVGKTNAYKVKKLEDVSKLSGPYDVKVERTTALAESKQGRIDQIVSLSQIPLAHGEPEGQQPGLFTREQILKMVEVADTPTFFEMATAAVEKADSENEDLFEGEEVAVPVSWETHVVHWNVHFQFMQSRDFTDTQGLPPEIVQRFLDHMLLTEVYMYELAVKNYLFAKELVGNSYYPSVYEFGQQPLPLQLVMMHEQPPQPPEPATPEEAAAQQKQQQAAESGGNGEDPMPQGEPPPQPDIPLEEPLPAKAPIQ